MKTEEDEAFEAIERRQGGFQAKRQMAADKLQEPVLDLDGHVVREPRKRVPKPKAQPAQEPHEYDWSMLEAAQESLREHMARIHELEEALAQPAQEPVAHSVIAGALFDFMGWLTSRKERIVLSSADNAAPAADAIRDFAKMQNLSLYNAQVKTWREALARPAQEPSTITFSASNDWVMRITADRRIEVNKDVEVTETAEKVLEAMQWMLKRAQREWVWLTDADIERIKLMTYEKETNADGEEQEAVNIDWLIKTTEHFCKEKNNGA